MMSNFKSLSPLLPTAEREAAKKMIQKLPRTSKRITLGADKGYDTKDFVKACAKSMSHPMWHRTQATESLPSTVERRVFLATPSAKGPENESKRALAG
jgi:hypothetical protein